VRDRAGDRAVDPVLRTATFLGVAGLAGSVTVIVAALREQVRAAVEALQARAAIDPLTRALNRGAFEDRLESEVARASRAGADCALLVLDVDHFKRISDSHGHAAGDEALRRLARASPAPCAARTSSRGSAARSSP
jgi:predicted signal transduction protein with EAL and GGDEF domain